MSMSTRSLVLAALLGVAAPTIGCGDGKVAASTLESVASDPTACQEQHPDGVVAFAIAPDGTVRAGATGADGQPARIDGGTLSFRKDGGAPTEAKLTPDAEGKVATAKGPAIDADVTAVDYAVQTGGKTLTGVIHLPAGGTKALADTATTAAAQPAPGPHGGQVQTLAGEPVEVAVRPGGEVVAYVLGPDQKPVTATAGRTIWVLIDAEKVALTAREDGAFVGKTMIGEPRKVTLVEEKDGKRFVVVVGHRPGLKVVATRAPGVVIANAKIPAATAEGTVAGEANAKVSPSDDGRDGKDKDKDKGNNGLGNDKPGTPGYKGDKDVGNGHGKGGGNDADGGKPGGKGKSGEKPDPQDKGKSEGKGKK